MDLFICCVIAGEGEGFFCVCVSTCVQFPVIMCATVNQFIAALQWPSCTSR